MRSEAASGRRQVLLAGDMTLIGRSLVSLYLGILLLWPSYSEAIGQQQKLDEALALAADLVVLDAQVW